MRRVVPVLICASICFSAVWSEAQDLTKEQAIEQFKELVTRRVDLRGQAARNERIARWQNDVADLELGEYSFLHSLARYFNREYDEAGAGLAQYLEQHQKFPTSDFDVIVGRIFLNQAVTSVRAGDLPASRKAVDLALKFYNEPRTVYSVVGQAYLRTGAAEGVPLTHELTQTLLNDDRLSDAAKVAVLKTIHGLNARRITRNTGPTEFKTFSATDLDGNRIAVSDYVGKVVFVDFWATWCGPCLREMPNVVKVHQKHRDNGLVVIGVSLDRENATDLIRAKAKEMEMDWPQIYEGAKDIAGANNIRAIPSSFLLDRTGKVRYTNLRGEELDKRVTELIQEKLTP